MNFSSEIFQHISDYILSYENSEMKFFDLPIICRDGTLYWSQFLLAASSNLMKNLLQDVEEPCLIIPDLDKNHVLTTLENLMQNGNEFENEYEDVHKIFKFEKEGCNKNEVESSLQNTLKCNVLGKEYFSYVSALILF